MAASKGKKKLDPRFIQHVARELTSVVNERFDGNQTRAARALGLSQAHLSHLMSADNHRGPGLHVLILLRDFTDKTIDELLGLPPPTGTSISKRLDESLELDVARYRSEAKKELERAREILSTVNSLAATANNVLTRATAGEEKPAARKRPLKAVKGG